MDDNVTWAFIVQQMLEFKGHEVMWAGDGSAGYGTYLLFRPDLVITDIEMPEQSGLDMAARMREHNPGAKVIYMSADLDRHRAQLDDEEKQYRAQFLQKPFSRSELMRLISGHGCKEGKEEEGR